MTILFENDDINNLITLITKERIILGFIDENNKEILIACTSNPLTMIELTLKEKYDKKFNKILLLNECSNSFDSLVRAQYYMEWYKKSQKYTVLNTRNFIKYKIKMTIEPDFRLKAKSVTPLIYVNLQTLGKKYHVVGVFDAKKDADKFIDIYYSELPVMSLFYASNDLTKEYLKGNKDDEKFSNIL